MRVTIIMVWYVVATFPFWKAENWSRSEGHWFTLHNHGTVTVKQSGLYLIYAQVTATPVQMQFSS